MCGAILMFIVVIMVIAIAVAGFMIAADILFGILFLSALGRYVKSKKLIASKMQCPNCSSMNVHLSSAVDGISHDSISSYGSGIGFHSGNSNIRRKRIATCMDCGFTYDYITADEVAKEQNNARGGLLIFGILFAISMILTIKFFDSDKQDTATTEATIAESESVSETADSVSETAIIEKSDPEGIVGIEVASDSRKPIDDFKYELSDDRVLINSYEGTGRVLEIASAYEIDGKTYKTDLLNFQIGIGNSSVKTLILDEGITEVKTAIFNSCDVENVFFPSTMANVYDYTLSYMHPQEQERIKIYYAGTQEEWEEIFTAYERKSVSEIDDPYEKGGAAADKLNFMMNGGTSGYDSTNFEFFFSANPDELKGIQN